MPFGVLIYRDDERRVPTSDALARITGDANPPADADAALSLFIDVSELEAAIVDAISPERDALTDVAGRLREATCAAARDVRLPDGRKIGDDSRARADARTAVREAIDMVARHPLPDSLVMRVSEGYAYYALFPETYAIAAEHFRAAVQPARVAIVGIRSIGTGLSAIVAETLRARGCDTWTCTVRPHGHPFDRRLALAPDLDDALREEARRGAVFAVVDEGPGLSGSSFAAVVDALERLAIPDDRIVLFPSWDPDPDRLKSERARGVWRRHARWCTDARRVGLTPERLCGLDDGVVDFSAGAWRETVFGDSREWPPAHPQHERWKVAALRERRIVRFAGLGGYGAGARERAARLFDLGAGVAPGALCHGFLELPFVPGTPLAACRDDSEAAAIGRYIGTVARAFPAGESADVASLAHVIETNVRELLGDEAVARVRRYCDHPPGGLPASDIDGRMLAHEWIRKSDGGDLLKVDALDHGRDHFYPGPQSPAWDLAAAALELGMDGAGQAAMLDAFERICGDRRARGAMAFFTLAYAAFRTGYAAVAAESLDGTDDGGRFARERDRRRRDLEAALARPLTPSGP